MALATPLEGCVASLRTSMQLLESSIDILDSGVNDFPRLSTVLQTTRHFELVSESELQDAQAALEGEIQPEIDYLFSRIEAQLERLERRKTSLIAKCELQEGRMNKDAVQEQTPKHGGQAAGTGAGAELSNLEQVKMQQLRQKKERLSYAVGRLELQATQRERQLRKSMAMQ